MGQTIATVANESHTGRGPLVHPKPELPVKTTDALAKSRNAIMIQQMQKVVDIALIVTSALLVIVTIMLGVTMHELKESRIERKQQRHIEEQRKIEEENRSLQSSQDDISRS